MTNLSSMGLDARASGKQFVRQKGLQVIYLHAGNLSSDEWEHPLLLSPPFFFHGDIRKAARCFWTFRTVGALVNVYMVTLLETLEQISLTCNRGKMEDVVQTSGGPPGWGGRPV